MDVEQQEIRRKRRILEHARQSGIIQKTCRYFSVSRSTFYLWKKAYESDGEQALSRLSYDPPDATNVPVLTPKQAHNQMAKGWFSAVKLEA